MHIANCHSTSLFSELDQSYFRQKKSQRTPCSWGIFTLFNNSFERMTWLSYITYDLYRMSYITYVLYDIWLISNVHGSDSPLGYCLHWSSGLVSMMFWTFFLNSGVLTLSDEWECFSIMLQERDCHHIILGPTKPYEQKIWKHVSRYGVLKHLFSS